MSDHYILIAETGEFTQILPVEEEIKDETLEAEQHGNIQ